MSKNIKFEHQGEVRSIALFAGMNAEELQTILKNVFSLSSDVVGFLGEETIIPVSLACKNPDVLPPQCGLIASLDDTLNNSNLDMFSKFPSDKTEDIEVATAEIFRFIGDLKIKSIISAPQARLLEENLEESNLLFAAYSVAVSANDVEYFANLCKDLAQNLQTETGRVACEAQDEVLQICDQLFLKSKITENQLLYLRHLVLIRDEIVAEIYDGFQDGSLTADDMAKSLFDLANFQPNKNGDDDEIDGYILTSHDDEETEHQEQTLTDNARKLKRKQPANKPEVVPSQLKAALPSSTTKSTTEPNAILNISLNSVTANSVAKAKTDLPFAQQQPIPQSQPSHIQKLKSESQADIQPHTRAPRADTKARSRASLAEGADKKSHAFAPLAEGAQLSDVVVSLIDNQRLSTAEAEALIDMIQRKDEYVMGAFELYIEDSNQDELADTLLRCVKLEHKKRRFLTNMEQSSAQQVREAISSRPGSNLAYSDIAAIEEGDENEEDENENEAGIPVIKDSLDDLLGSLGVRNVWSNKVPDRLIQLVFSAAKAHQISSKNASAVCDLFLSQDEWVREAWNVYILQEDESDFLDTVTRILRQNQRIKNVGHVGNAAEPITESKSSIVSASASLAAVASSSSSAFTSIKQSATAPSTNESEPSKHDPTLENQQNQLKVELAQTKNEQARVLKSKEEAVKAIQSAKQELLKHSVDMMVRSDLMTQSAADKLINSSTGNNSQLDEAIDAYAQTRNISAFLGTLQALSSSLGNDSVTSLPTTLNITLAAATTPNPITTTTATPAAASSQTREQEELTQIILELSRNNIVNPSGSTRLLGLIRNQDADLVKSYNTLLENRNFDAFIESVTAMAAQPIDGLTQAPVSASVPVDSKNSIGSNTGDTSDGTHQPKADTLSQPRNQKAVIDLLVKASALTKAQAATAVSLVDAGDVFVRQVFEGYEKDGNLGGLLGGLRDLSVPVTSYNLSNRGSVNYLRPYQHGGGGIAVNQRRALTPSTQLSNAATMASSSSPRFQDDEDADEMRNGHHGTQYQDDHVADNDDDDYNDDNDDGEDENDDVHNDNGENEGLDEDDNSFIEGRFLEIVKGLELTPLEASALRLAISGDDELVREALANFKDTYNRQQLEKDLKKVVVKTLAEIKQTQADFVPDIDDEEDEAGTRSPRRGVADDVKPQTLPAANTDEDNTEEYGDDEEEEDEGDDDQDNAYVTPAGSDKTLAKQAARNHVFPILIQELVKETILTPTEGAIVMRLFSQGSAPLTSALDRYDVDHDMGDLVVALQSLADNPV